VPITIHPPEHLPAERILLVGKEGTGKTQAVLSVARRCPDAQFYVIDTDYSASYDRMMFTEFGDVGERGNVTTYVTGPDDWRGMMDAARDIQKKAEKGDWVVVDSMTPTWSAAQGFFTEEVHGDDIEGYLLDVRKKREEQKKAGGKKASALEAFDGWMDWSVINATYFRLYKVILQHPGHLILTAEGQAISDTDSRAMRDTYAEYGVRPAGQKKLGFLTHTVLLTKKGRKGDYTLTTVKDRGREDVEEIELDDFAKDYLQKVAGWKPTAWKGNS
jgi:hypothetical protein